MDAVRRVMVRVVGTPMSEPFSSALAVFKSAALADKMRKFVNRLASRRTEQFIAQRDEMFQAWTSETAARLSDHIRESTEAFLLIGGAIEDHEHKLEQLFDAPEIEVLEVLYCEAAYREALEDRRNMLKHAAAAILDLEVTIADKCRAEKVLRDLDPDDVLELDRLDRLAGAVERFGDGKGRLHFDEDRHRYNRLLESRSADALLSSEGVRVMSGKAGGPTALVTVRGRIILHLLRSYVLLRRRPASGRESVPGARSREAAVEYLGKDFINHAMKLAALARVGRDDLSKPLHLRQYRVQFDFPKPQLDTSNYGPQPIVEPAPDARARLHIWPCPRDVSQAAVDAAPKALDVKSAWDEKEGFATIQIDGPFDVLRWLAEQVDAWWT
jgi:hypothetical protein